ncbi:SNF5 / SMARCB1 / INI1-like protein 2 [Elsinoe fawcettii]|nr:SNF5 / SMARCB1 / INI1-like protein 2 [Elsinoe fawcettii]
MAGLQQPRRNIPQAFVSSYAPRMRAFPNSLLTPNLPQTAVPSLRTTKRGTTRIDYADDFDDDAFEDSDAPRRNARSRRQMEDLNAKQPDEEEQGTGPNAPVEVQAIWREWMGKPKRSMTEKQVQVQAALPTNLVPIKINLEIPPFQPEPPLPKPGDMRERGLDENAPAYRLPEVTPAYKLADYFMWNLHEALTTPDQFAKVLVDDLDLPTVRKQEFINSISSQIRTQLEEHASIELHPYFSRDKPQAQPAIAARPALSRDQSQTPFPGTPAALLNGAMTNGVNSSAPDTPLPNGGIADGKNISVTAEQVDPVLNPDDSFRCVVTIGLYIQGTLLSDKFEWSLLHPPGLPELLAKQTCADLGLSGEWVPALAHSIYDAVLQLKKGYIENNGTLVGVANSGIGAYGEVENEAAEVHGDGSYSVGEGAGWRYDDGELGLAWQPKLEVLDAAGIAQREVLRERELRRMRRDLAARAAPKVPQRDSFYGGLGEMGGEEERMGRGERAKKKRRFRSLSPNGRDTPDLATAFGDQIGKLSEAERQTWRCSHCQVWGTAVWSVRDGPAGPRTLCNNCGYLYEQSRTLPPWSRDLYAGERDAGSNRYIPTASHLFPYAPLRPSAFLPASPFNKQLHADSCRPAPPIARPGATPQPDMSRFVPNPARAHQQTFFRHSTSFTGQTPTNLPEQYAATVRGGGPQMFEDYAVEGEDLDWTKVQDPRERKRLQNIINGRKYRERRLAQEGELDSPQPSGPGSGSAFQGSFPGTGTGSQRYEMNGNSYTPTPADAARPQSQTPMAVPQQAQSQISTGQGYR